MMTFLWQVFHGDLKFMIITNLIEITAGGLQNTLQQVTYLKEMKSKQSQFHSSIVHHVKEEVAATTSR